MTLRIKHNLRLAGNETREPVYSRGTITRAQAARPGALTLRPLATGRQRGLAERLVTWLASHSQSSGWFTSVALSAGHTGTTQELPRAYVGSQSRLIHLQHGCQDFTKLPHIILNVPPRLGTSAPILPCSPDYLCFTSSRPASQVSVFHALCVDGRRGDQGSCMCRLYPFSAMMGDVPPVHLLMLGLLSRSAGSNQR